METKRYMFKFIATGTVVWLEGNSFIKAYTEVELRFGAGWRNLGHMYVCQLLSA